MYHYLAYGVSISTGLSLDSVLPVSGDARFQLEVNEFSGAQKLPDLPCRTRLGTSHGRELFMLGEAEPSLEMKDRPWCFEVADVVRFHWSGGSRRICWETLAQCDEARLEFWLIHIFLPLYFTLEGDYEFIHACSVEVAGKTILFIAPSHGGKSTLTDYFLQREHRLVSDDKVATYRDGEQYFAVPSHPNHRPYRKFEDLGMRVREFSTHSRQIDAIYVLQAVGPEDPLTISGVAGHQGFARLLPSYLFNFPFLQAQRLRYLAGLLDRTPLFRVEMPWDLERLEEVYRSICEHVSG